MQGRYQTHRTDTGFHVYDAFEGRLSPESFQSEAEADMMAFTMERRTGRSAIYTAIDQERERQDDQFAEAISSASHLAVLAKKTGDVAASLLDASPRDRQLTQELVEVAAVAIRWLEHIEATR